MGRPIPHIRMTKELDVAAGAVRAAKERLGPHSIVYPENPLDPQEVAAKLAELTACFADPKFFFGEESTAGEACDHLINLAMLFREHCRAGNVV
jgi:hypothetical protein